MRADSDNGARGDDKSPAITLRQELPGVWQVYDRHLYLEEQAPAYAAWLGCISKFD